MKAKSVKRRDVGRTSAGFSHRLRGCEVVGGSARWALPGVIVAATLLAAAAGIGGLQRARAETATPRAEQDPATQALQSLRRAWFAELEDLTASARTLAVADDAYDFVAHPNLGYVFDHFAHERLAADRIDTVLVIDRNRKPVFWRKLNDRNHRGFPDAQVFLSELPALRPPDGPGVPTFVGAARRVQSPSLVVAMPIYPASRVGDPRGWVILGRTLDAAQWRRYAELANINADLIDPATITRPEGEGAALRSPLTPVVLADATQFRGFLALPDLENRPLRVFSVSAPRPAVPPPIVGEQTSRSTYGLALAAALAVLAAVLFASRQPRRGKVVLAPHLSAPDAPRVEPVAVAPAIVAAPQLSTQSAPAPRAAEFRAAPELEASFSYEAVAEAAAPTTLEEPSPPVPTLITSAPPAPESASPAPARTIASLHPVFRYQPQFDLKTGRLAGAECLLYVVDGADLRAADARVLEELGSAGLGMELAGRCLREACSDRRFWRRQTGQDFPLGVPVPPSVLADAGFLPLVRQILAEFDLPGGLLELQVPEKALAVHEDVRNLLFAAREAGLSIAVDRFTGAHMSLHALSNLPVTKLRVAATLAGCVGRNAPTSLLAGIVGAARGLGMLVCATDVDAPELLEAAERHGCQLAQGTELGRAGDSEQFLAMIRGSGVDTVTLPTLEMSDTLQDSAQPA